MGFLGGLIGGITGFLTGGPAGAIIGAAGGLAAGGSAGQQIVGGAQAGFAPRTPPQGGGLSSAALPSVQTGFLGQPLRGFAPTGYSMPGTGSTSLPASAATPVPAHMAGGVDCNIRGHHLNKSRYYTKGKYALFGTEIVPHEKGTVCVKNRRMNVGNAKALRHALRRAYGFEKLAMRTIRLLHPQKHGRFGGFKRRTRARR